MMMIMMMMMMMIAVLSTNFHNFWHCRKFATGGYYRPT